MANKIKYGLKNVYYAKATIAANGSATYATPVAWPGAVNLSLDAQGDITKFRADNINYWTGSANNGYEGDFESALIPDSFRKDILGEADDANDVVYEEIAATGEHFALLFQFEGDASATRHVLYNCTATRPSLASQTTEESIEPVTETITISAASVYNASLDKDIVKARCTPDQATQYNGWFSAVYQPSGTPIVTS